MASMSTEKATSSSSYDVFLSFRGEDTRNKFTDHLYHALNQKGICTFKDDVKLKRGESISSELSKAIEESRFAIVIFSREYASSTWCLEELAKIVGCRKEKRMIVLPVFYNVDPSHVRNQKKTFAKAFVAHEARFKNEKEKVKEWRDALREVANIAGWTVTADRPETKFIQDIVDQIFNKLNYTSVDTGELVAIDSRVDKLMLHLDMENTDIVRIIGIWGTGGMGKTTLARVVYGRVSNQFDACAFIPIVRDGLGNYNLLHLQKTLLNQLLMERDTNIHDVGSGVQMIQKRLCQRKILLVLDDVNELEQLEKLAWEKKWFGPGSRVIITTRNKNLLGEVDDIYEAEGLNSDESFRLFNLKAFPKKHPTKDYLELSHAFVEYADGLPLAIEVLGSFLVKRKIDEWKSKLDKLKELPERKILNVFQTSYDELDVIEKDIFLNIACFLNHKDRDNVIEILNYLDLHPIIGLQTLIEKSLLKLNNNQLWMHDLLQEMGRDIIRRECPQDPGKRSRLWLYKDIDSVLTNNTGTYAIQYIVPECGGPKKVYWNAEAFSKMQNLKFLKICCRQLMHDLKYLPNSLRYLDWHGYPSKSLPSSFHSDELIELHMQCSNLERLWNGRKSFERLKFILLDDSPKLIETPDFTEVPNLEKLILKNCINLREVHPSIGVHRKLILLDLEGCKNLKTLPSRFEMESLKILNLSGCSKVKKIPEFGRNMERVYLDGTAIIELPTSIEHLNGLTNFLNLRNCKNLVCLPNSIFNSKLLKYVDISGCSKLESLPENLGNAESIEELDVSGTAIRQVPSSICLLKNLKELSLRGCNGLSCKSWYGFLYSTPVGLPPLLGLHSLIKLDLRDCKLKKIPNGIGSLFSLRDLDLCGNDFICLPEIDGLSNLETLWLDHCTNLQSLPKLPSNVWDVGARVCSSLQMLLDQLKVTRYLHFDDCFKMTSNQGFIDMYIAMIKNYHQGLRQDVSDMNIVIPGSKIPEWFSHQSMGTEVHIKEPSHLCNDWVGMVVCVVFCSNCNRKYCGPADRNSNPYHKEKHIEDLIFCSLITNGEWTVRGSKISILKILSDHLWLIYVTPEIFNDDEIFKDQSIKSVRECDANGFCQIGIRISTKDEIEVKQCGFRMVYKKDIEDNTSITPCEGLDDGAGSSGEGSSNDVPHPKRLKGSQNLCNSDGEESSGFKECGEELSDWEESSESDLQG